MTRHSARADRNKANLSIHRVPVGTSSFRRNSLVPNAATHRRDRYRSGRVMPRRGRSGRHRTAARTRPASRNTGSGSAGGSVQTKSVDCRIIGTMLQYCTETPTRRARPFCWDVVDKFAKAAAVAGHDDVAERRIFLQRGCMRSARMSFALRRHELLLPIRLMPGLGPGLWRNGLVGTLHPQAGDQPPALVWTGKTRVMSAGSRSRSSAG
jgi:hypothetical protein